MNWGERIDARLRSRDNAAAECMAMIKVLAADRDMAQGLLKKSMEREAELRREIEQIEVKCCECHAEQKERERLADK